MVKQPKPSMSADLTIDTSGTRCPIPLLKAKQALRSLEQGQYLCVISTDPSSVDDFAAMLSHLPHTLVSSEQTGEASNIKYQFLIQKG